MKEPALAEMSIFIEVNESQFTVKGSKLSTVSTTVGFLKPLPAAAADYRTCD